MNAAQLPAHIRKGLWAEGFRFGGIIQNNVVTPRNQDVGPPYQQFHGEPWKGFEHLHKLGHVGTLLKGGKLKAKISKLEYRISHMLSSMESLYEENKKLKQ